MRQLKTELILAVVTTVMCLTTSGAESTAKPTKQLEIPKISTNIIVDGKLEEDCYRQFEPLTDFCNADLPLATVPLTKAWTFWTDTHFILAFECHDTTPAMQLPTDNERDVDGQDRPELYLWSGNTSDWYYCFEIAPLGAVHDYKARFYREFDSTWSTPGMVSKSTITDFGYRMEMSITKEALAEMGFKLQAGAIWHGGLFRSDFDRLNGTPTWLTWVRADLKEADFHVFESLGTFKLIEKSP